MLSPVNALVVLSLILFKILAIYGRYFRDFILVIIDWRYFSRIAYKSAITALIWSTIDSIAALFPSITISSLSSLSIVDLIWSQNVILRLGWLCPLRQACPAQLSQQNGLTVHYWVLQKLVAACRLKGHTSIFKIQLIN
jgi:hypothetical protein